MRFNYIALVETAFYRPFLASPKPFTNSLSVNDPCVELCFRSISSAPWSFCWYILIFKIEILQEGLGNLRQFMLVWVIINAIRASYNQFTLFYHIPLHKNKLINHVFCAETYVCFFILLWKFKENGTLVGTGKSKTFIGYIKRLDQVSCNLESS